MTRPYGKFMQYNMTISRCDNSSMLWGPMKYTMTHL